MSLDQSVEVVEMQEYPDTLDESFEEKNDNFNSFNMEDEDTATIEDTLNSMLNEICLNVEDNFNNNMEEDDDDDTTTIKETRNSMLNEICINVDDNNMDDDDDDDTTIIKETLNSMLDEICINVEYDEFVGVVSEHICIFESDSDGDFRFPDDHNSSSERSSLLNISLERIDQIRQLLCPTPLSIDDLSSDWNINTNTSHHESQSQSEPAACCDSPPQETVSKSRKNPNPRKSDRSKSFVELCKLIKQVTKEVVPESCSGLKYRRSALSAIFEASDALVQGKIDEFYLPIICAAGRIDTL